MSDQKQARLAVIPPSLNKMRGRSNADIEEECITGQFREAIAQLPTSQQAESWAAFLYGEFCEARVAKNMRRKAGSEGRKEQAKQLKRIASAAERLGKHLKEAGSLVFDSWASASDVDRSTATQEWLHLKYLVEIAATRASQADQYIQHVERVNTGRPGDAMARPMSEAAALVYVQLGKPIDQGTKRDSFSAFLATIFDICDINRRPEYWVGQVLGLK
jgi:hypothetical protein